MSGMRIVAPLLWLPALTAFAGPMTAWGLKGAGGSGTRTLYAPAFIGRSAAGRARGGNLITERKMTDKKDDVADALAQPATKPTMPVRKRKLASLSIHRVLNFGARARLGSAETSHRKMSSSSRSTSRELTIGMGPCGRRATCARPCGNLRRLQGEHSAA